MLLGQTADRCASKFRDQLGIDLYAFWPLEVPWPRRVRHHSIVASFQADELAPRGHLRPRDTPQLPLGLLRMGQSVQMAVVRLIEYWRPSSVVVAPGPHAVRFDGRTLRALKSLVTFD